MPETSEYDYLWPLANEEQKSFIVELRKTGDNLSQAERNLGRAKDVIGRSLRRLIRLAEGRGLSPDHGLTDLMPPGFNVERLSMLRRQPNGDPYWAIGKRHKDTDPREHAKRLSEDLRAEFESGIGLYPATAAPTHCITDLIADYRFGDPHFGMYGEAEYNSGEYTTDTATKLTRGAIDLLVQQTPSASVAHLTWIGDNTHANDYKHETPQSHNRLDMDPRGHGHALMAACRAAAYSIRALLTKHEIVVVNILEGNHDPDAAHALNLMLAMLFENEPRAVFTLTRPLFRHYEYGKVMLSYHHGDKVKKDAMPLLMATDEPEMWGRTKHREVVTGHIHHETVKEVMGVRVVSLSTLGGQDAYHYSKGYRSLSATTAAIYHREYGELSTVRVSAAMINDLTTA